MVSKVRLKFPKFATNLAISLHSCQSNRELGNEVGKFTANFVGKLTSSSREKFPSFDEIVSEFPYTLRLRRLGITSLKMGYKTLQLNCCCSQYSENVGCLHEQKSYNTYMNYHFNFSICNITESLPIF